MKAIVTPMTATITVTADDGGVRPVRARERIRADGGPTFDPFQTKPSGDPFQTNHAGEE